jgi:hypothetical protein
VLPVTALHSRLADKVGALTVILLVLKRRRQPKDPRPQPEGVNLLKHVYTIQVKNREARSRLKRPSCHLAIFIK